MVYLPLIGNYYHFMTESALALYLFLKEHNQLERKDCKIWYQGRHHQILQLLTSHPIFQLPEQPREADITGIDPNIVALRHPRPRRGDAFYPLIELAQYLDQQIPYVPEEKGIAVLKRTHKRCYAEHDQLVQALQSFDMPVREVQFETMTFAEQVNLCRNTRIMIGAIGAAFTNMMFLPPGAKLIELSPLGYKDWIFPAFAQAFGHEWTGLDSTVPGVMTRTPPPQFHEYVDQYGWPIGKEVWQRWQHRPNDYRAVIRTIRDVMWFSIPPEEILSVVSQWLASGFRS